MIINNGPIGSGKFNPEKDLLFTYTLDETQKTNQSFFQALEDKIINLEGNSKKQWALYIYKTCDITLNKKIKNSNIILVGGGQAGSSTFVNGAGSAGGDGGFVEIFQSDIAVGTYTATIGNGGIASSNNTKSQGESTLFNYTNPPKEAKGGGQIAHPNDTYGKGGAMYSMPGSGGGKANPGGNGFKVTILNKEYYYGAGGSSGVSATAGYIYSNNPERTQANSGYGIINDNETIIYWGGIGGINFVSGGTSQAPGDGVDNTGSGGGGSGAIAGNGHQTPGNGGSGVIIIYN